MTIMEEAERRRKALAFQEKILGSVTQRNRQAGAGVMPAPGTLPTAAEGRAGRADEGHAGQKIANSSAGARAPEAPGEPARTKPDRRENEFMMNLMILRNTLRKNAPSVEDRAKRAGAGVWEDIVAMNDLVERVQEALLRTMPENRDEYYRNYALYGHYELRMNGPVRTARHVLISDVRLGDLCEAAMKSECILCLREGKEIGRCRLREALLEVAPPSEIQEGLWRKCEYRGAAGDVIHGRDVTI